MGRLRDDDDDDDDNDDDAHTNGDDEANSDDDDDVDDGDDDSGAGDDNDDDDEASGHLPNTRRARAPRTTWMPKLHKYFFKRSSAKLEDDGDNSDTRGPSTSPPPLFVPFTSTVTTELTNNRWVGVLMHLMRLESHIRRSAGGEGGALARNLWLRLQLLFADRSDSI